MVILLRPWAIIILIEVDAALEILKVDPVRYSLKQLIVAAMNFRALS